ncbi:MAG: extracellular solute-binding protein [Eubacterium sp.]|nr:extracellular solute-binding protein [Eubacterium sp.]
MKAFKKILSLTAALAIMGGTLTGCGSSEQVVLYTNADDEAVTAMKNALDNNGYSGKYILQTFGTSELGGKLLAEGKNIEADLITMSSYYIDSAQEQSSMFLDLTFEHNTLTEYPSYYTPITCQEGAIIINTQALEAEGLDTPTCIKDLAKEEYSGKISVPDIAGSSTGWLLVQDVISAYDEEEAKEIMTDILKNAGPHLESSGSGPIKKVRAGEVPVAFGLRHQAVRDKNDGLPIDYVDPTEGNFSLTESIAVIDHGDKTNPLAMEMAECIIKNGRAELLETYPTPIYEGETADAEAESKYPETFDEKLTVELLTEHKEFVDECR